ncbi:hypothetical protein [Sulfobacillus thermosulfidooxidans]|uniref:hypothetical protein n=1 Tax=Sulfobacillus thermosulfidooxidans TaxID=28034 RepID=UPI000B21B79D|nr:hypothetical protein [Sulfobacillus thermosulfidooxidans]
MTTLYQCLRDSFVIHGPYWRDSFYWWQVVSGRIRTQIALYWDDKWIIVARLSLFCH